MLNREAMLNYLHYVEMITLRANHIRDEAFLNSLHGIKFFYVDENIMKYLSPNYTTNKIGIRNMPFDRFILLNSFELVGQKIKGMIFTKFLDEVTLKETIGAYFIVERYGGTKIQTYNFGIEYNGTDIKEHNLQTNDKDLKWNREDAKLIKEAKILFCNFLDFLNHPEVISIKVERTEEQNKKRIKRGKPPLPSYNFIKVTGQLKNYVDSLNDGSNFSYSHKFWVRGHFRTLRDNQRYGDKAGTKIWIPPFVKGQGMLIEKAYNVCQGVSTNG